MATAPAQTIQEIAKTETIRMDTAITVPQDLGVSILAEVIYDWLNATLR